MNAGADDHPRHQDLYQAASLYYVQGETMESIGRTLQVSRSTVSRLLKEARSSGVVRISLTPPSHAATRAAARLGEAFGIRCHLVPVRDGTSDVARLDRVARVAAGLLSDLVVPGTTLGIAWGTTLASVVDQLPTRPTADVRVVQLNGAANHQTTGIPYVASIIQTMATAFSADVLHFPVPAFFDHAATRDAMFAERSVRRVLNVQRACDIAIFGVGALSAAVPSHVYSTGYLNDTELTALERDGVVGDICTVLLREDGSWADIGLNRRASGPSPDVLSHISRRLCVAAGPSKLPPLLGALRAGAVTDLIIDEDSAALLVRRAGLGGRDIAPPG